MNICDDILYCIFFLVNTADYPNLARSCKHFSKLLLEENLWRKHCTSNQINQLEGSYLKTFKMCIHYWYQEDMMGQVSELKREAIVKVSLTELPSFYIYKHKFTKLNNKLSFKLLSSKIHMNMGFTCIIQNETQWNNHSHVCTIYDGYFYRNSDLTKINNKVMVGDIIDVLVDYESKYFNIQINNIVVANKLSSDSQTRLVPYVIVDSGVILLL